MQNIESIFNQNVISLHDDDILVISINKYELRNLRPQDECEFLNAYIEYLEKIIPNKIIGIPSLIDVGVINRYPKLSDDSNMIETLPF